MISFIKTNDGALAIHVNGKVYNVASNHPNYEDVKTALVQEDTDALEYLLNKPKQIHHYYDNEVEVRDGELLYKGEPLHNSVASKVLEFMDEGLPAKPIINFLRNLMQNPSAQSINELYDFLEHRGLPITEDGCFVAYKGLRSNYYDKFSGKIYNGPGQVVEFDRNQVDDDRRHQCSFGLHVGTYNYARGYGELVVTVKVDPRDCVSVPLDRTAQKLRVSKYQVLETYEGEKELDSLYIPSVSLYDYDDEDDLYEDYDDPDDLEDDEPYSWIQDDQTSSPSRSVTFSKTELDTTADVDDVEKWFIYYAKKTRDALVNLCKLSKVCNSKTAKWLGKRKMIESLLKFNHHFDAALVEHVSNFYTDRDLADMVRR